MRGPEPHWKNLVGAAKALDFHIYNKSQGLVIKTPSEKPIGLVQSGIPEMLKFDI
jgi:hypothetical protein